MIYHLLEEREQAVGVGFGVEGGLNGLDSFLAHLLAEGRVFEEGAEGGDEFGFAAGGDEQAGFAVADDFGDGGEAGGDDREAGRARFGEDHGEEVALGGEAEEVAGVVEVFEFGAVGLHVVVDEQARFGGEGVTGDEVEFAGVGLAEGAEGVEEAVAAFAGQVAADEEDAHGSGDTAGGGKRGGKMIGAEPCADIHAGGDHEDFFCRNTIIVDQTCLGPDRPGNEPGGALVAKLVKTVFEVFEPGGIGFVIVLGTEGVVLKGGAVEGDDAGEAFEPVGGEDGGDLGVEKEGVEGGAGLAGLPLHGGEEGAGAPTGPDGPVAFVNGDVGGEAFGFKGRKAPVRLHVRGFGDEGLEVFAVGDVAEGLFDNETDTVHRELSGMGGIGGES